MFEWLTGSSKKTDDVPIVSSRLTNVVDPDGVQAFLNTNHPTGTGSQLPFTLSREHEEGLRAGRLEMAVFPTGQPPQFLQSQSQSQSQPTAQPMPISFSGQSTGYGGAPPRFGMQSFGVGGASFPSSAYPGMLSQQQPSFQQQQLVGQPFGGSMLSQPPNIQQFSGVPQSAMQQQPGFPQSLGPQGSAFNPSMLSQQQPSYVPSGPQGGPQNLQFGQTASGFQPSTNAPPFSHAALGAHSAWNAHPQGHMGQPSSFFQQSQNTSFGVPPGLSQLSVQQQPMRWGSQIPSMAPPARPNFYNALGSQMSGGLQPSGTSFG